jgi:hypothetical protein
MKRRTPTLLLATACGRSPAAPEARRAAAGAAHDGGFLGSGNRAGSAATPP